MTVTVLLFASYADALGAPSVQLDLPTGATVKDVVKHLRQLRGAERLPPAPLVAVNQRFAQGSCTLHPGDEVAVIPPVAGG